MCLDSPANSEGKSRTSAAKAEYRSTIYGTAEAVPFQDQLSRQVYGAAEAVHFQDQLSRQVCLLPIESLALTVFMNSLSLAYTPLSRVQFH
jgi:hypothetical protein